MRFPPLPDGSGGPHPLAPGDDQVPIGQHPHQPHAKQGASDGKGGRGVEGGGERGVQETGVLIRLLGRTFASLARSGL